MEEICSECDFDESAALPGEVAAALPPLAKAVAASIRSIPDDMVRHRPAPDIWSPVEYLGHLRESMAFHRWLIERALAEDNPLIPTVDPDESVTQSRLPLGRHRRVDRSVRSANTATLHTADDAGRQANSSNAQTGRTTNPRSSRRPQCVA